jgi:D-glycero-alpha-D-manno-heptose-7-phosphate kinase
MILTRSPLRISIGGGGTDLPSYYRTYGGFLVAMGISKHVYVSLQRTFDPGILLKYSTVERVSRTADIRHPIIREALLLMGVDEPAFEVTSIADVPAGTGLGSSGSFTTALLKALAIFGRRHVDAATLAELACTIEIDRLHEPIGKQDQYIAAFGGLTAFTFNPDNSVHVESLRISDETVHAIEENVLLFFTGRTRSASDILKEQAARTMAVDDDMISNLHRVKEIGQRSRDAFLRGRLDDWGEMMREHWEVKKRRSAAISSPQIDEWHDLGLRNGAIGGKVVGAGGGGFLLFCAHDPRQLRRAMTAAGLRELRFHLDAEGTKVLNR